jgi:hypothetical protein
MLCCIHQIETTLLLVRLLCTCSLQLPAFAGPDHLQGLAEAMSAEHVLSGSRHATAQAVAAAIACNMPVLLEGPAAVGKTSLVTAIARFMPQQQVLERVNNTESTGLQVRPCSNGVHLSVTTDLNNFPGAPRHLLSRQTSSMLATHDVTRT